MRVLIVAARFPEHGQKGDQVRTRQLIELLADRHELHVVACGPPSSPDALHDLTRLARVTLIRPGPLARWFAALELLLDGLPVEVGWMSPRRLRVKSFAAAQASDVVIASTVRVVWGPLPAPLVIDHIDPLSVNLRERARLARNPTVALAAAAEARLLERHERLSARWASAQLVVSPTDVVALPQPPIPVVLPQPVFEPIDACELTASQSSRDIDVILTGNMRYPPNRDAAEWLAQEIVPELRRARPDTRVVIAGRRAESLALDGIELAGDVPDLGVLLRRARIAIVPLRAGTGVPYKLLEAAAAGAAIVATPHPARAAGVAAVTGESPAALAKALARLLDDEHERVTLATRALADLAARDPCVVATKLESVLADACEESMTSEPPKLVRTEESP